MPKLAEISVALGLSILAWPAIAKQSAATIAAETVLLCDKILSDPTKVIDALQSDGWKDVTPKIGGRSMAVMTGSYQLRRKKNMALVSVPKSIVGANCQFDFAKLSDLAKKELEGQLTNATGTEPEQSENARVWLTTNGSISILKSNSSKVTILWLPKKEDAE